MKIVSVYTPLKKCAKLIKEMVQSRNLAADSVALQTNEIIAEQNKILLSKPSNRVNPQKVAFKSTKEMFTYAKDKCIKSSISEGAPEYTVIMNIKENKVIAEYKGTKNECKLSDLDDLPIDNVNTVLMHNHAESHPISSSDVSVLLKHNINQVIAVDKNGQYSLVARRGNEKANNKYAKRNFIDYVLETQALYCEMDKNTDSELYKHFTHSLLKQYMPNLNVRYWTNYDYLRK